MDETKLRIIAYYIHGKVSHGRKGSQGRPQIELVNSFRGIVYCAVKERHSPTDQICQSLEVFCFSRFAQNNCENQGNKGLLFLKTNAFCLLLAKFISTGKPEPLRTLRKTHTPRFSPGLRYIGERAVCSHTRGNRPLQLEQFILNQSEN